MAKKRAFVRYSKQGKIVPGSLILTGGSYPNGPSTWQEVPADLCCDDTNPCTPANYGNWRLVTGGEAGDGVVLKDYNNNNNFTFVGPNDDTNTVNAGNGWVYLTRYFPTTTCLLINYNWTSFDEGTGVDRPVYWISATEPTGEPSDTTAKVGSTPDDGTWNITIPGGQWFGVGIYSTDSCCGRGFLSIDIVDESPCTLFSDTIYWGEDSATACGQTIPIAVTGDGTTFCNSNNFTGPAIAGIGTGGAFFSYGGQLKTVNVISGSPIATFNGGCDPCP